MDPLTLPGVPVRRARGARERLLGLMFRPRSADGHGPALLLAPCRSVHTCFMRFPLDLIWLSSAGAVVRVDRDVPPWRVRTCLRARSVVEVPAGALSASERVVPANGGSEGGER